VEVVKAKITPVYKRNNSTRKKIVVNIGGSGSSKSYSVAQLFIKRLVQMPNRKMLVTRKTGPALYLTAYSLVIKLLKQYRIYYRLDHDKTHKIITNPQNGAMMVFLSIDDPEKIKSTDWNDVWMEEANEFDWNDFIILQTRMRETETAGLPNQIFLCINPDEENGWINQRLILSPAFEKKIEVIWSSYKDNPNLGQDYIDTLEGLKEQDIDSWKTYAKGRFGAVGHIIYKDYMTVKQIPEIFDEEMYGLDFGYNNQSALLKIGMKDKFNVYLKQMIYKTHLTNTMLIDLAKEVIGEEYSTIPLYADCAEPDRIEEFKQAGFNIFPSDKQVKAGIDFCKRFKFYTLDENVDLNAEAKGYKWRKDKNGNVLDEPVKFKDHLMDAKRYALWTHYKDQFQEADLWLIE